MAESTNKYFVYFSTFLEVPYLNTTLYVIQIILVRLGLTRTIFLTYGCSKWQHALVSEIPLPTELYVRTPKLGRALIEIPQSKIFDDATVRYKEMPLKELYELMWTLMCCSKVTRKARSALSGFIYSDFSVDI